MPSETAGEGSGGMWVRSYRPQASAMMLLNTNEKNNANESVCNMCMSKCLYGACVCKHLCTVLYCLCMLMCAH